MTETTDIKISKFTKTLIAFLVMTTAVIYLFFGPTGVRQGINMRKARNHIPTVNKVLQQYPSFKNIQLSSFTGRNGSILVAGELESQEDINKLEKLIDSTNPPVNVQYAVRLKKESEQKPKEKK